MLYITYTPCATLYIVAFGSLLSSRAFTSHSFSPAFSFFFPQHTNYFLIVNFIFIQAGLTYTYTLNSRVYLLKTAIFFTVYFTHVF